MPSNTRNRPSAASRSVRLIDTDLRGCCLRLVPRRGGGLGAPSILQKAEEFPIRGENEEIALLAERALVGLEAAIEGVELRIVRIGVRVDLRGGGIALAARLQRLALGIREDHRALPLGGRADGGVLLLALGAQAVRGLGEGLLHALVDAGRHL